jgi:RING-like zinc finger
LQQLQQHYLQQLDTAKMDHHPQGDTNSSSRSTASANGSLTSTTSSSNSNSRCGGIRSDPEIMLKQYMEALLPSTIVTNEWMSSIVMIPTTRNNDSDTTTIVPVPLPDHHPIDTELGQPANDVMIMSSSAENRIPPPSSSSSSSPSSQLLVVVNMDDNNETVSPDFTTHPQHSPGDEEDGMAAALSSHLPTCSICLQELSTGQAIYTVDKCQHYFHSICLQEWILQPMVVAQRRRQRRRRQQQQQQQRRRRPSRRLLRSCTSNNHCPNCRTPIIAPESKLEDVLHFVFTSPPPTPPPQPSQL